MTDTAEQPVSPALKSLKDRRAEIKSKLHLDLQVPRWTEPEIWVRFAPLDATKTEKALEARRESKADEWAVLANADLLATACVEVWGILPEDDTRYSLNTGGVIGIGPLTRFDRELAEVLEVFAPDTAKAVDVVRALYWTDGDLIAAANTLVEWSGKESKKADEGF